MAKTYQDEVSNAPDGQKELFIHLKNMITGLGHDAYCEPVQHSISFGRSRKFAYLHLRKRTGDVVVRMRLDHTVADEDPDFLRHVRLNGVMPGSSDVLAVVASRSDLLRIEPYLRRAYENA